MYTRYRWAAGRCEGREVLEVACGAGVGLGLLAARARSVVGGDIDETNCEIARQTYESHPRITVRRLEAEKLPFRDRCFDLLVLFEALYYLTHPDRFFQEARRVLRPGGLLLISTANCEWTGFNPSRFSMRYFNARELGDVMTSYGFYTRLLAGFPENTHGLSHGVIALLRRVAARFHLIPKTMKGKGWLKRIFYGKLTPLPQQLAEGMFEPEPLVDIGDSTDLRRYRFLYAMGRMAPSDEVRQ